MSVLSTISNETAMPDASRAGSSSMPMGKTPAPRQACFTAARCSGKSSAVLLIMAVIWPGLPSSTSAGLVDLRFMASRHWQCRVVWNSQPQFLKPVVHFFEMEIERAEFCEFRVHRQADSSGFFLFHRFQMEPVQQPVREWREDDSGH